MNNKLIMPRLLVMSVTRIRPDRLMRMVDSFLKTKHGDTKLVVYISVEDPRIAEY
jgi:hypothetical protein